MAPSFARPSWFRSAPTVDHRLDSCGSSCLALPDKEPLSAARSARAIIKT